MDKATRDSICRKLALLFVGVMAPYVFVVDWIPDQFVVPSGWIVGGVLCWFGRDIVDKAVRKYRRTVEDAERRARWNAKINAVLGPER